MECDCPPATRIPGATSDNPGPGSCRAVASDFLGSPFAEVTLDGAPRFHDPGLSAGGSPSGGLERCPGQRPKAARSLERLAIPGCQVGRSFVCAVEEGVQGLVRRIGVPHSVVSEDELPEVLVPKRRVRLDRGSGVPVGGWVSVGVEDGIGRAVIPGPKSTARYLVRVSRPRSRAQ